MFAKLLSISSRHRLIIWAGLAVTTCIMVATAVFCGSYSNDLTFMFPENSISGNMFRTIQNARMTQAIQMEICLNGADTVPECAEKLDKAVEKISKLENVESASFRFAPDMGNIQEQIIKAAPLIFPPDILDNASPDAIIQNTKKTLATPGVPVSMLQKDPFGLTFAKLQELDNFRKLGGIRINQNYDFLTDSSASRTVILVQADFKKPPAAKEIQNLFNALRTSVTDILPGASASFISPLTHQLDNETTVKRDISAVSIASVFVLILLFILVYKSSYHTLLIPLLPLIASAIITGLFALIFKPVCLFVLGISGGIAGLAVDQGIHVFSACAGKNRLGNLKIIVPPLFMSMLTSAAVFFLITATGIKAYIQLGIFSGMTLALNLALSLFILPPVVKRHNADSIRLKPFIPGKRCALGIVAAWLALLIAAAYIIPGLKYELSMTAMDGASNATRQAELDFQKRWLNENQGIMAVATAESKEKALDRAKRFSEDIKAFAGTENPFHPAILWPTAADRAENLKQWLLPQNINKIRQLKKLLAAACAANNLPESFFQPFFNALQNGLDAPDSIEEPELFRMIDKQLIKVFDDCTAVTMFIPAIDSPEYMKQTVKLAEKHRQIAVINAETFRYSAIMDILPRFKRILLWLVPVLLIPLIPLLKNPLQLLVVALPGITSFMLFTGLSALMGIKLNLITLFSAFMLTGLVIDYGIFALHSTRHPGDRTIPTSLMLSALTTTLTFGALMLSGHPVMFHTGLVISSGIAVSALTSLFAVPAITTLLPALNRKSLFTFGIILMAISISGCASLTPRKFSVRELSPGNAQNEIHSFRKQLQTPAKMTFHAQMKIFNYTIPMILAVNTRPDENSIKAIFTTPNGISIASYSMIDGKVEKCIISDAVPPIAKNMVFRNMPEAIYAIFAPLQENLNIPDKKNTPVQILLKNNTSATFDGTPLRISKLANGTFPSRNWQITFFDWNEFFFQRIIFRDYRTFCTLTLNSIQTKKI